MKIIRLTAKDFMGIKAVEIKPGPNGAIVISGRNGAGKTSVLDAIALAVAGKKFARKLVKPIREGERSATVTVETDNGLTITRRWTKNGTAGALTIQDKDKKRFSSPQEFLDKLIGDLSFDPLSLLNARPQDQRATLLPLVELSIDPDALDAERAAIFEKRTGVNRTTASLRGQLDGMERPAKDLPAEEVSVTQLVTEHTAAVEVLKTHQERQDAVFLCLDTIRDLEEKLRKEQMHLPTLQAALEKYGPPKPPPEEIQAQMGQAEEINRQVRAAETYEEAVYEEKECCRESMRLTAKIEEIDKTKADALAAAKFPVDGLGFDENGITFNGIPFQQCALSEQLKVSIGIAMALNPEFRVIRVTDASLLDPDNMAVIEQMAKEKDFQVWLEVVSAGDGVGICIEEGEVVEPKEAPPTEEQGEEPKERVGPMGLDGDWVEPRETP